MTRRPAFALCLLALACGERAPVAVADAPVSLESADREAYARQNKLILRTFDLNRDKRPDVFKFFRLEPDAKAGGTVIEQIARKDVDLNHDGKVDLIRSYASGGELTEERTDLDFDGRFDEVALHERGVLAKKEIDLDYDGRPDVLRYYAEGKLSRIESDTNGDGRVDTWEYYERGELDRIGTDTNADGEVDQWERAQKPSATAP